MCVSCVPNSNINVLTTPHSQADVSRQLDSVDSSWYHDGFERVLCAQSSHQTLSRERCVYAHKRGESIASLGREYGLTHS
jgi:hypothetical protein